MTWRTTGDVDEFLATAGGFLRADPARNTILLTVAETLRTRGATAFGEADPLFGWWRPVDTGVRSAFLQTPPHPLLLAEAPGDAAPTLAEVLAAVDRPLPGVNAGAGTAEAFAATWRRLTGAAATVSRRTRLHRLDELVPPRPAPPGSDRVAAAADRDLLVDWYEAFGREIGEPGGFAAVVDDALDHGGVILWEVDGVPVSMASRTRVVAGMARVAPVYTLPELRGRGYAGAVTVAVSRAARDAGATEVVLFTDLANPTSNALYQRLGYRPVEDHVVLSFAA